MITAERLKELIKQGATIWVHCIDNREFTFIELDDTYTDNGSCLFNHWGFGYSFEYLFETKNQAEWHRKMTTERTERFEPPMWGDLVTPYHFTFIIRSEKDSSDMGVYGLHIFQSGIIIEEDIESAHSQHYLFDKDFTKENYEKACEIVRDLFNKGGAK